MKNTNNHKFSGSGEWHCQWSWRPLKRCHSGVTSDTAGLRGWQYSCDPQGMVKTSTVAFTSLDW